MSLISLGMSAEQERAYRYFLRRPQADLATAADDLGLPCLERTVAELRERDLISERLVPVRPAVAVDLLVRRQMSGLTAAWDALIELGEEHRSGRPIRLVEHLGDADVTKRMTKLIADGPHELLAINPAGPPPGSAGRILLPAGHPSTGQATGHRLRITREPLWPVAIVDRTVAFAPAGPPGGTLEIRLPGLVTMLVDVFEGMWARARDLGDQPLAPIEHQVLDALTRYGTDDAAARALNVSVRKFRAHVAELMSRLGARTRFQAALRARAHGWL
ncbi:hypothetical protein Aca07nite_38240 [Actinoplanes capillaceus]|uniref:HTH luxR-type domain-containing protein n=1 Tax=Actinoplanes campanulatus TaxID=113559 RepID=A0ABQ3WJX1_9ACTN|nr:hypothetical protein [Actinoplanes capillaceus]GID46549.1 hypothetical protein Aca07nite_38240 [Actinoplanes capillaceus]